MIGFTPRILKEDPKSLVRFDHVASGIVNADHSIMRAAVKLFAHETFAQSDGRIISSSIQARAIRGDRANGLTQRNAFGMVGPKLKRIEPRWLWMLSRTQGTLQSSSDTRVFLDDTDIAPKS